MEELGRRFGAETPGRAVGKERLPPARRPGLGGGARRAARRGWRKPGGSGHETLLREGPRSIVLWPAEEAVLSDRTLQGRIGADHYVTSCASKGARTVPRPHVPRDRWGGSSLIMSFDEGCAG